MDNPRVSIVIPVYNGKNYLKEAIDSALRQTYSNIEVIVVNDGSIDNGETEEIAKSYNNQIRYFSKPNGGVSTALNLGIGKMTGEYFSWLSHDDIYKPRKIERQIEFLQKTQNSDTILYGGYEIINEKGKVIDVIDYKKLYPEEKLDVSLFPIFRGLANGCTMLIHKSHFERVGKFDESLSTTQDYDLWFRMFRNAKVKFLDDILIQSRIHRNQASRTMERHTVECDNLWVSMLESLAELEVIELGNSKYRFYSDTADYLKMHSSYKKAERYARTLADKEMVQKNGYFLMKLCRRLSRLKIFTTDFARYIRRSYYIMKYDGFYSLVKKVIRKI